jgi:hypothetical protein
MKRNQRKELFFIGPCGPPIKNLKFPKFSRNPTPSFGIWTTVHLSGECKMATCVNFVHMEKTTEEDILEIAFFL